MFTGHKLHHNSVAQPVRCAAFIFKTSLLLSIYTYDSLENIAIVFPRPAIKVPVVQCSFAFLVIYFLLCNCYATDASAWLPRQVQSTFKEIIVNCLYQGHGKKILFVSH